MKDIAYYVVTSLIALGLLGVVVVPAVVPADRQPARGQTELALTKASRISAPQLQSQSKDRAGTNLSGQLLTDLLQR
ncbi:hypothetical protein J2X76_002673 [Neorhizobium sp. 2083]|uniref:hypothetical protein n=1 Tax=Neorhizobium sp. 2083 TaxID=2817762 RepID=UPI00285FA379|nr:hypothetical protein [Neorhizobium sp. 2083]MDR6817497.1 hypothetical protein [Neorhizobium sp. 2083]